MSADNQHGLRDLDSALDKAMERRHNCKCGVCHDTQADLHHRAVMSWVMTAEPSQAAWVQAHADDDHGRFLQELLEEAWADGQDVAGLKAKLERMRAS